MKPIAWDLSNQVIEEAPQFVEAVEGRQILKILSAVHDKNAATYTIKYWSALNEAQFEVVYRLKRVSKTDGSIVDNQISMRSLNALAKAIYGPEFAVNCTIPNPAQATGCAVVGEVKLNPYSYDKPIFDENGEQVLNDDGTPKTERKTRIYKNVDRFDPITASDVGTYSDHADQYCVADPE